MSDYLTLLTAKDNKRCNKLVSIDASGEVVKRPAPTIGMFTGVTHRVADQDEMVALLRQVADDPAACLCQGYFPGSEPADDAAFGASFDVVPKDMLNRISGKEYQSGAVLIDGTPTYARVRSALKPSSWIQLDRDAAPGMPKEYLALDDEDWLDTVGAFCPGLDTAGVIRVGSTSGRVLLDGKPLDASGCRYWIQIEDPSDYMDFGQRLKLAAYAAGYKFEKQIKNGTRDWTIFDPTVFSWERLVFDGMPSIGRGESARHLSVGPPQIDVWEGGRLDTSLTQVSKEASSRLAKDHGLHYGGQGSVVASGYLSLETKIPTRDYGTMTVEDFFRKQSLKKVPCQAVFRPDSNSWNAFLVHDDDGMPRLFDNGDRTWYELGAKDKEVLRLKRRRAIEAARLPDEDRALLSEATHESVAEYARQQLTGKYLFAVGWGWLKWTGTHWADDTLAESFNAVRRICTLGKRSMHSLPFMESVLSLVGRAPGMRIDVTEMDTDLNLLNTPAGVLDLRSMSLTPHDPKLLMRQCTEAAPEGGFEESRFATFLQEITNNDEDLERFLQRSLGACLSGAVEEHWLMYWTGSGRNGKNTLGDLVKDCMGTYAAVLPTSALMSGGHNRHPTELMEMAGRRLMVSSEISAGASWDEARLNSVTGDDMISAHRMRQDFVQFRRTHKHLLYGNRRPMLRDVTPAIAARMKVVPFSVSFIGREDGDLPAQLRAEMGVVMTWLIEGWRAWFDAGKKVGTCAAVDEESSEYMESQDTIECWIEDCCIVAKDQSVRAGMLYTNFINWAQMHGEFKLTGKMFGERMRHRFKKTRRKEGVIYFGIGLPSAVPGQVLDMQSKKDGK